MLVAKSEHGGACFTEQMENYGLPDYAEYGQNRPPNFDRGVEYNAWLEYLWDTVFEFCLMMLEEERYVEKDISASMTLIIFQSDSERLLGCPQKNTDCSIMVK